jgi:Flp pilus assembly protein CpaB
MSLGKFFGKSPEKAADKSSKSSVPDRRATSGALASADAQRLHRRWWRDTRVVGGVAVVAVCMLVGARIVTLGEARESVWQVTRDLSAGASLSDADVTTVEMPSDISEGFISANEIPDGRLVRDVRAGELLSSGSLVTGNEPDVRWVTVPVAPLHAPEDLAPGDRVDLWSTPRADLGVIAEPELVLPDVLVAQIFSDTRGFQGDFAVVVEVLPQESAAVLRALRTGAVDLVRVPFRIELSEQS